MPSGLGAACEVTGAAREDETNTIWEAPAALAAVMASGTAAGSATTNLAPLRVGRLHGHS